MIKKMKLAAIDIGSNSVRLLMWADGKTLYKAMRTTRLGEGLNADPYLGENACLRTAQAVADFSARAKSDGAEEVFAFATAAVRSSKNPELFLEKVRSLCGLEVDVISGEKEAEIGLAGALGGRDGGIIDVGGASTEVIIRRGGKIAYCKSVAVGTVRILDAAGRNLQAIKRFIAKKIEEYGDVTLPCADMFAVGGTASRLAAIKHGIREYDSSILNGTQLTREEVFGFARTLTEMSVEEIKNSTICASSADLIGGGAALMGMVMEKFGAERVTVSESDNLEGYIYTKIKAKDKGEGER